MPTINQLVRKGRKTTTKKIKATALRRSYNAKDRLYVSNFNPQNKIRFNIFDNIKKLFKDTILGHKVK